MLFCEKYLWVINTFFHKRIVVAAGSAQIEGVEGKLIGAEILGVSLCDARANKMQKQLNTWNMLTK